MEEMIESGEIAEDDHTLTPEQMKQGGRAGTEYSKKKKLFYKNRRKVGRKYNKKFYGFGGRGLFEETN